MFGNNNDDQNQSSDMVQTDNFDQPIDSSGAGVTLDDIAIEPEAPMDNSMGMSHDDPAMSSDPPPPAAPPIDDVIETSASSPVSEADSSLEIVDTVADPSPAPKDDPVPITRPAPDGDNGDLMSLKQAALEELSPLVKLLDQSPEERFKTTMMMIQATDDKSLVKSAHEAAQQIPDEKARAQALLDVVNEINYFTQNAQTNK